MFQKISIRAFLEKWDAGYYSISRESMIDAGWYDWFCSNKALYGRLKRMVDQLKALLPSSIKLIWTSTMYGLKTVVHVLVIYMIRFTFQFWMKTIKRIGALFHTLGLKRLLVNLRYGILSLILKIRC